MNLLYASSLYTSLLIRVVPEEALDAKINNMEELSALKLFSDKAVLLRDSAFIKQATQPGFTISFGQAEIDPP